MPADARLVRRAPPPPISAHSFLRGPFATALRQALLGVPVFGYNETMRPSRAAIVFCCWALVVGCAGCAGCAGSSGPEGGIATADAPPGRDTAVPVDTHAPRDVFAVPGRDSAPEVETTIGADQTTAPDVPRPAVDLGGGEPAEDAGAEPGIGADTGVDVGPALPCGGEPIVFEDGGELVLGTEMAGLELPACGGLRFWFRAAAGSQLELALAAERSLGLVQAVVAYPDDPEGLSPVSTITTVAPERPAVAPVSPPRSGELLLLLRARNPEDAGALDLTLRCTRECDRVATRYPIVLVHGWTGWSEIVSWTYFYQVPEDLADHGFDVHVASLDPYNSIVVRSEQLAEQLELFLAESHATKLNVIAHSQGGLDTRRAISTLGYGDRTSALVTISTPHRGTGLLDAAVGLLPEFATDALTGLLEWLGATVVGSESDAMASFESMTRPAMTEVFNPANPDDPRVSYISYAGRTCLFAVQCDDVCDVEIRWAHNILYLIDGPNDGIVPVESAIWGDYRGELPADHFDEVGQLFGVTNRHFDHKRFYRGVARDLAAEGH